MASRAPGQVAALHCRFRDARCSDGGAAAVRFSTWRPTWHCRRNGDDGLALGAFSPLAGV